MKHSIICYYIIALSTFASASHAEEIPKLPSTVIPPEKIAYNCVSQSKTLPCLDICRADIEIAREHAEEYNKRIKRFCDFLTNYDGKLRNKVSDGKLSWDNYEDLKDEILIELEECKEATGDYYAPYRARMREYRKAITLLDKRTKAIIDQMDI